MAASRLDSGTYSEEMSLSALVAVALVLALAALAAAARHIVVTRRRVRAVLAPLVGGSHPGAEQGSPLSVEELLERVAASFASVEHRCADTGRLADRLTDALSAVPEGVIVCDEHGQVWFRNEVAQVFAGARHGEALADLAVTELLDAALRSGPAEQYLELYGPPRRTLLIRALPLQDDEAPVGAVAIIEDVSERRRLEAVRRDFVANVSHELKSPVGALGILAEAMQLEDEPAVSRRLAERMHAEAFRVARIIDDLLDLSRIESEEAPLREPLPVHTVVAQAVERMRPVAELRGITIDVSEGPRRLSVIGDRRQLISAVHNLLDNAVKYSDDGSVVEVRIRSAAEPPETWTEISVEDHGIGIPTRDIERIFERFYRVDRARARDTGGTGLGLAIVRHVATNHRGEVRVSSQEGQGSVFTLRFPAGPGPVVLTSPEAEAG